MNKNLSQTEEKRKEKKYLFYVFLWKRDASCDLQKKKKPNTGFKYTAAKQKHNQ